MRARKMRQLGQIACGALGVVLFSAPAFAQEGSGLNLVDMFAQMGVVAPAFGAWLAPLLFGLIALTRLVYAEA